MFAIDDDFPTSPKLESIEDWRTQALAVACWSLLGAACRKRGNGGVVTRRLLDDVLHRWPKRERLRAAEALVAATGDSNVGLWEADGRGWRFHDWDVWQPSADESAKERKAREAKAERQRRWRLGKRLGVDGEASTEASTGGANEATTEPSTETAPTSVSSESLARRDAHACAAHVPVPSRPVPEEAAAAESELPVSTLEASAEWHRAMGLPGGNPNGLHSESNWRTDYETWIVQINRLPWQCRRTALRALCMWAWHAPDGPVRGGRIDRYNLDPSHIAKRVSKDIRAAEAWYAQQSGAAA